MAPKWPQDGPKMASRWSKMAPRWPQDGPKKAPRWPQDGPKQAGYQLQKVSGLFWGQESPKMAQKMAPRLPQNDPKMAPRWPCDQAACAWCFERHGTEQHPDRYNHMQCWCHCLGESWWVSMTQITTITCNAVVSACEKDGEWAWWHEDKMTSWQDDKITRWQDVKVTYDDKVTRWQDEKMTRWQGDKRQYWDK